MENTFNFDSSPNLFKLHRLNKMSRPTTSYKDYNNAIIVYGVGRQTFFTKYLYKSFCFKNLLHLVLQQNKKSQEIKGYICTYIEVIN